MSSKKISRATVICLLAAFGGVFLIICLIVCKNIFSEEFLLYYSSITASAELGILICCIVGVAAGIAEILLGKVNRLDKVICSVCTFFCICFILGMLLPSHINSRVIVRRISCASNLREIYLALQQYAADYAGNYPSSNGAAGLETLRKNDYIIDYALFACPSTSTVKGKNEQLLTEELVDYVYIGGLNTKSDSNLPIVYDKANNHGYFGNVLFVDGTVKGIKGNPWTQNIKK